MGAVRYVDDKFSQAIATTTTESVHAAVALMNQCNGHYRDTLKIGEEDPIADGLFIYLGHLLIRETPLHWGLMHFMKNMYYTAITGLFSATSQVYRTEHHYHSYQPRYMLRGQRFGRILSTLRQSDPKYREIILVCKVFEYRYMLGDPISFQKSYLYLIQLQFDLPVIKLLLRHQDPKIAQGP